MPEKLATPRTSSLSIPHELSTPYGKLVYLYLWLERRTDVGTLSRELDVPQIRLYPVLRHLVDNGHATCEGPEFVFRG